MPARREVREWGSLEATSVSVGIDQSYSGFAMTALSVDGGSFRTRVYKAPGSGVGRLDRIYGWTRSELRSLRESGLEIRDVAAESPVRMSHSALISGELWGIVRLACLREVEGPGQFPLQVAPATLKKYITGKGTGVQKNQILLHVYKKWGVEFPDDNAADSYGLARIAASLGGTAYEHDVIDKLRDPKYRDPDVSANPS